MAPLSLTGQLKRDSVDACCWQLGNGNGNEDLFHFHLDRCFTVEVWLRTEGRVGYSRDYMGGILSLLLIELG